MHHGLFMAGGFVYNQSTLGWDGTKVSLLGSVSLLLLLTKNLVASRFIKDIWEGVGQMFPNRLLWWTEGLSGLTLLQQPHLKIDFGKEKKNTEVL